MKHPMQPVYRAPDGMIRFKENKIVQFLLDAGPFDLNQLAMMAFEDEDHEQLAQLIGYSVSGFGELPYVSDETFEAADKMLAAPKAGEPVKIPFNVNLDDLAEDQKAYINKIIDDQEKGYDPTVVIGGPQAGEPEGE